MTPDRSDVADGPGRPSPGGEGKDDDTQREHRQAHEFKYQSVHGNISQTKPIDL
jgi:hypothetical protein